mmetsp:Transcript_66393/g.138391  ORF Transcript_66393/g.138391 Transcript_66393/m.138391 type:complete len:82 (+) Transcript_66393:899-1144(+)
MLSQDQLFNQNQRPRGEVFDTETRYQKQTFRTMKQQYSSGACFTTKGQSKLLETKIVQLLVTATPICYCETMLRGCSTIAH